MSGNYITSSQLVEVAWEVCNQVGGIYTVIRSKVPTMMEIWKDNYCLVGPYFPAKASAEFEPESNYDDPIGKAVLAMREKGMEVHYGYWLVSGRPKVVLINPFSVYNRLGEIKYLLWEHHGISTPDTNDLLNQVIAFGYVIKVYLAELANPAINSKHTIAHLHEWMVGTAIPEINFENINVSTVFTTHATMLGRYLAMNDPWFYDHLPFFNWEKEAKNFDIE